MKHGAWMGKRHDWQASACLRNNEQVEATRERLLEAANRLFLEAGSRGATTRRIAREAGVNEVTLFRHFAGKEELLSAAVEHGAEQGIRRLAAGTLPAEPGDVRGELRTFLLATLQEFTEGRRAIRVSMAEWERHPSLQEPLLRTANYVYRQLRTYVKKAQVRGLIRADLGVTVMTEALIATIIADGLLRDLMPERFPLRPAASIDAYLDILLQGLLPEDKKGVAE